jgi:Ca2+-binding RTX toxin-like protein
MATFTGTNGTDVASAPLATLTGFTGGTLLELADPFGDIFICDQGSDTVAAAGGDDLIRGQLGADSLFGGGGADTIEGGQGNDTLDGSIGDDSLVGGDDDDLYIMDSLADIIVEGSTAGSGIDTVQTSLASVTITWANVENLTYTGTGNFTGTGNDLANVITGAGGNDTLIGGLGADTLLGRNGDDVFRFNTAAEIGVFESVSGGGGNDTIELMSSGYHDFGTLLPTAVEKLDLRALSGDTTVNMISSNSASNQIGVVGGFVGIMAVDGSAGHDIIQVNGSIIDLSEVVFTSWTDDADAINLLGLSIADDSLVGTAQHDIFIGRAGKDTMIGNGGDDAFRYSDLADFVAQESIDGGLGTDAIELTIAGSFDFRDLLYTSVEVLDFDATSGTTTATFGGSSTQFGASAINRIDGSAGVDSLIVIGANVDLSALTFVNYSGGDTVSITGTAGNDVLTGTYWFDTISGGEGDDTLYGLVSTDRLLGGNDDDELRVQGGAFPNLSLLDGGDDYDIIAMFDITPFNNALDLSQAQIIGVEGLKLDVINGAATATLGGHQLGGAVGFPIYDIIAADLASAITLKVTGSFADLGNLTYTNWNANDQVIILGTTGADYLLGSSKADLIGSSSNAGIDLLSGFAGNDTLFGGADADELNGGEGGDWLDGGAGADDLDGNTGFDFASYYEAAAGVTARLDYSSLNTGDAAGDTYTAIEGLIGTVHNDFLVGATGGDYLTAQGGDDYLAGEGGNDTIRGDGGQDHLWGGEGADALDGGGGYDIARYDFALTGVVARLDGGVNSGEATGDTYAGVEALYGSAFGDYLIGDNAGNVLCGLDGDDLLYGLGGDDILLGGTGIDAFAFNTSGFGTDGVLDFATTAAAGAAHDYVDFRGLVLASFAINQVGANTHVVTDQGTVILQGITASTLVAGDFLF